jgi:hypothetical protein
MVTPARDRYRRGRLVALPRIDWREVSVFTLAGVQSLLLWPNTSIV